MRRHASAGDLADFAAGDVRPRKAVRISAHLESCDSCRHRGQELDGVSALLASVTFERLPDRVSARIDAAIATEARRRVASEPATEAGRGELPARSRQAGWRLPFGSSPMALRIVAATAAAVVVVGGAYELANHGLGASSSTSSPAAASGVHRASSAGLATNPASSAQTMGPEISAGPPSNVRTVRTETSGVDFTSAQLQTQVTAAVKLAKKRGVLNNNFGTFRGVLGVNAPGNAAESLRLSGCIDRVTSDLVPELVDIAKFNGSPATVIVVAAHGSVLAQVWVVGSGCSKSKSDVLDHKVLGNL